MNEDFNILLLLLSTFTPVPEPTTQSSSATPSVAIACAYEFVRIRRLEACGGIEPPSAGLAPPPSPSLRQVRPLSASIRPRRPRSASVGLAPPPPASLRQHPPSVGLDPPYAGFAQPPSASIRPRREFTCQVKPGSLNYEDSDAEQFASWGVDYLRYLEQKIFPKHDKRPFSILYSTGIQKLENPLSVSVPRYYVFLYITQDARRSRLDPERRPEKR